MVTMIGGITVMVVVRTVVLVVVFMTGGVAIMVVLVTRTVAVFSAVTVVTLTVFLWSGPSSRRLPGTIPRTPLEQSRRS